MKWASPDLGQEYFLMWKNDINSYHRLSLEYDESYLIRLASRQCLAITIVSGNGQFA